MWRVRISWDEDTCLVRKLVEDMYLFSVVFFFSSFLVRLHQDENQVSWRLCGHSGCMLRLSKSGLVLEGTCLGRMGNGAGLMCVWWGRRSRQVAVGADRARPVLGYLPGRRSGELEASSIIRSSDSESLSS